MHWAAGCHGFALSRQEHAAWDNELQQGRHCNAVANNASRPRAVDINPFPVKRFVNFTAGSSLSQEEALLSVSRKCVFGDMSLYNYILLYMYVYYENVQKVWSHIGCPVKSNNQMGSTLSRMSVVSCSCPNSETGLTGVYMHGAWIKSFVHQAPNASYRQAFGMRDMSQTFQLCIRPPMRHIGKPVDERHESNISIVHQAASASDRQACGWNTWVKHFNCASGCQCIR